MLTFVCLRSAMLDFGTLPGSGTTGTEELLPIPLSHLVEFDMLTQGMVGLQVLSWLTSLVSKVGLSLGDNAEVSSTVFNLLVSSSTAEHSIVTLHPITSPFSLGYTLSLFMLLNHT